MARGGRNRGEEEQGIKSQGTEAFSEEHGIEAIEERGAWHQWQRGAGRRGARHPDNALGEGKGAILTLPTVAPTDKNLHDVALATEVFKLD